MPVVSKVRVRGLPRGKGRRKAKKKLVKSNQGRRADRPRHGGGTNDKRLGGRR